MMRTLGGASEARHGSGNNPACESLFLLTVSQSQLILFCRGDGHSLRNRRRHDPILFLFS
jgi:hypothetical protein